MVNTGVFTGSMLSVSTNPARMLAQASRLMGLKTEEEFSLIGE